MLDHTYRKSTTAVGYYESCVLIPSASAKMCLNTFINRLLTVPLQLKDYSGGLNTMKYIDYIKIQRGHKVEGRSSYLQNVSVFYLTL